MTIRVIGAKPTAAKLRKAATATRPLLVKAVTKITKEIEADAKTLVPVRTSTLQNSINGTVLASFGDQIVGQVVPGANYALYVEFGTSKMAAQPFLFPALNRHKGEFFSAMEAVVRKVL